MMIAAALKDSEEIVKLLLNKGADANEKSESSLNSACDNHQMLTWFLDNSGQVRPTIHAVKYLKC